MAKRGTGRRTDRAHHGSVLHHIDALRVLRADDDSAKSAILDEIGADGPVERQIVTELARTTAVRRPEAFEVAHRHLMRAVEVLERNGAREVTVASGPRALRPVLGVPVQLVTRWIVKNHVTQVARSIRALYEQREAAAVRGSAEHVVLRRARMDTARVEDGLRSGRLQLPAFLLGGAFLTGAFSTVISAVLAASRQVSLLVVLAAVTVLVLLCLSWVTLYAAAVARQRIRLTTDWALTAVYEALGAAGRPPRDHSYNLAIVAIALLLAAVLVVPLAGWLLAWNGSR